MLEYSKLLASGRGNLRDPPPSHPPHCTPCADLVRISHCVQVTSYEETLRKSWVHDELRVVRNCNAAMHYGLLPGLTHALLSCVVTQGAEPWTLSNTVPDSKKTKRARECTEIVYPKADGLLTFDLLTNLQRSGTMKLMIPLRRKTSACVDRYCSRARSAIAPEGERRSLSRAIK